MYEKHRIDSRSLVVSAASWVEWPIGSGWVLLAGLVVYIVWDVV
jgi:hypothetical protein